VQKKIGSKQQQIKADLVIESCIPTPSRCEVALSNTEEK
jgi:hypothetical protein